MDGQKPAVWMASSKDDLREFPADVRRVMGFAINDAQNGDEHPAAKALKGFGGRSVLEVVDDFDGDTYRAVYTVRFAMAVYVLHCFQKKSRKGRETSKHDIAVHQDAPEGCRGAPPGSLRGRSRIMSKNIGAEIRSGNVFADLGFDNPEEELLKAKLAREIRAIIKRRRLTQTKAAELLGMKQPDISAIVTGRIGKFTIDRLVRCLDRLDYKVEVIIRQKPRKAG
jgi:phage-related protein/predicted XRE-type DNA-binding protein